MMRKREIIVRWEGCVLEQIDDEHFHARLIPSDSPYEEMGTFQYSEFPLRDQRWLIPGGIFYWWVWNWTDNAAETHSTFKVRKAYWVKEDVEKAMAEAKKYSELFQFAETYDDSKD